jgi:hypothetical protein
MTAKFLWVAAKGQRRELGVKPLRRVAVVHRVQLQVLPVEHALPQLLWLLLTHCIDEPARHLPMQVTVCTAKMLAWIQTETVGLMKKNAFAKHRQAHAVAQLLLPSTRITTRATIHQRLRLVMSFLLPSTLSYLP